MEDRRLVDALALAASPEWDKRCKAVPLVVALLAEHPVHDVLLRLLLDDNTAVTEVAAGELLRAASPSALAVFARGWLVADDNDTLPQMADHLRDWADQEPYDWPLIVRTLREMQVAGDAADAEAIEVLLVDLAEYGRTHD